jgi:hypothetical protein
MDYDDQASDFVSALESHTLRRAFNNSISELAIPEAQWAEHASAMVRDLTGVQSVDARIVAWIIRK